MRNATYTLVMTPTCEVQVSAPLMSAALSVARDALPHLLAREGDPIVAGTDGYELTCLLCGKVNPEHHGRSPLVALQEHQMETHGLGPDDFSRSARIARLTEDRACYIWAVLPECAVAEHLPQLSYTHAAQSKPVVEDPDGKWPREANMILAFKQGGEMTGQAQLLYTTHEDAYAWYGYPLVGVFRGELCAWPKGEWEHYVPTTSPAPGEAGQTSAEE